MQQEASTDTIIFIIKKYQKQGYENLSLSDLAVAVSSHEFREYFLRYTGIDWAVKYEIQALQKLQNAHFDMQWMIQQEEQSQKPFFLACKAGNVQKIKDILKKSDNIDSYKTAVDRSKSTGLHIAADQSHSVLLEFLLLQGFNPNARDKNLKTPLHYACNKGDEYNVNLLLQKGADIKAADSNNRTALHYACCSSSSHVVMLIIGMCPEIINITDNNQLTALHYAILNNSAKQIEIVRTLIEHNININARDNEGKTALWHAAHQGKSRPVPILLQKGADINISDYDELLTPIDVAANQRTRELLVVYSQSQTDQNPRKEDVQWMDQAIRGEKIESKKNMFSMPEITQKQNPTLQQSHLSQTQNQSQLQNQQTLSQNNTQQNMTGTVNQNTLKQKDTMSSLSRERFFQMMKNIQHEGVKAYQHIKKPFIYTGSWMEGIQNLGDLYQVMSQIQSTEAVLCVFNLLCPYDKPLPQDDKQEVIDGFYGDPWKAALKSPLEDKLEKEKKIQAQIANLDLLKKKLRDKEKALTDKVIECNDLQKDNADLQSQVEKLQNQNPLQNNQNLENEFQSKEQELSKTKKKLAELKQELKEKNLIIEQLEKNSNEDEQQQDNAENIEKIVHLEEELRIEKQKNKVQRFKSGQIFLKALSNNQTIKKQKGAISSNQDNLQDDEAIIRMFAALKDNPPNFITRLQAVDKNSDNKLTVHEFIEFCNKLKLSQQDIMSLQRITGFTEGRKLLGIEEFKKILQQRPLERQASEERLFKKILDAIEAKGKTLEEVFQEIDTDNSGEISSSEFRIGLENLKIILTQRDLNNIFCIFDKDKSNSISLAEMKDTIDMFKDRLSGKILDDNEDDKNEDQEEIQQPQQKQINYEQISEDENGVFREEGIQANNDDGDINGQLRVQIPRYRKFPLQNQQKIFIQISLGGLDQEVFVDQQSISKQGDIQYTFKMNIRYQTAVSLNDYIYIKLFKSMQTTEESYIGEVRVAWKACIVNPEIYHISREFTVVNLSYPQTEVQGYLGIQAKYTPQIVPPKQIPEIPIEEEDGPEDLIAPKEYSPVNKQESQQFPPVQQSRNQNNNLQLNGQKFQNNPQNVQKNNSKMQYSNQDLQNILEKENLDQKDLEYLQDVDSDVSGFINIENDKNAQINKKKPLLNSSNIDDMINNSDLEDANNTDFQEMDSNVSQMLQSYNKYQ